MHALRTSLKWMRYWWLAGFALLLAIRLIGSAGYMPMVEHGRLTVMLCPDGEWTATAPAMPGMDRDHGSKPAHHQQCFYAAATAIPFTNANSAPLLLSILLAFAFLVARTLPSLPRSDRLERPHSTGPPLPA